MTTGHQALYEAARRRVDLVLAQDRLRLRRWDDPVLDLVGHEAGSRYVERFWTGVLGPTTVLLVRRLASVLEAHPEGHDLAPAELARGLGVAHVGGRNSPLARALSRAVLFDTASIGADGAVRVRSKLAPLNRRQVLRLPADLRAEHDRLQGGSRAASDPGRAASSTAPTRPAGSAPPSREGIDAMRRRARQLALSLAQLGEDQAKIETQLIRWRYHPALSHEAARWAAAQEAVR